MLVHKWAYLLEKSFNYDYLYSKGLIDRAEALNLSQSVCACEIDFALGGYVQLVMSFTASEWTSSVTFIGNR